MHRRNIRSTLTIALCILFASCAGFKDVTYFSATPRSDIHVGPGSGGPPDWVVHYPLSEKVKLSLTIFDHPEKSSLLVTFYLPQGESLRFEQDDFVISNLDGSNNLVVKINEIEAIFIVGGRGNLKYLKSGEEMLGESYEYKKAFGGTVVVPRPFTIRAEFTASLPDQFILQMPSVRFSGKTVSFPKVEFRRKMGRIYQGSVP